MSSLRSALTLLAISAFRPSAVAAPLDWHTDLEAAKAESARTGRPILSLRMLGRLDEELSCANSRFFRTILYVDPAVAKVMRERFVLHWSSERPVPKITIDFGDGRTITRTVTGNSAHYVLDAHGRVIDVIPGLYEPAAFASRLDAALALPNAARHLARSKEIQRSWGDRLAKLGDALPSGRVAARDTMELTVTKRVVELPMLIPAAELARLTTDKTWDALLEGPPRARLSAESLAIMRAQNPQLDAATFDAMVERTKMSLDRDTLLNEYLLHQRIHAYLATHDRPDFATMNAWIYGELFATPASDPWLGLHDDTIFTGLQNAGLGGHVPSGERLGQDPRRGTAQPE